MPFARGTKAGSTWLKLQYSGAGDGMELRPAKGDRSMRHGFQACRADRTPPRQHRHRHAAIAARRKFGKRGDRDRERGRGALMRLRPPARCPRRRSDIGGSHVACCLPIDEVLPQLLAALRNGPRALLIAPPGAGKTTRVAPALLAEPWVEGRQVLLLVPRRLAARSAAEYIARERGERPARRSAMRPASTARSARRRGSSP